MKSFIKTLYAMVHSSLVPFLTRNKKECPSVSKMGTPFSGTKVLEDFDDFEQFMKMDDRDSDDVEQAHITNLTISK